MIQEFCFHPAYRKPQGNTGPTLTKTKRGEKARSSTKSKLFWSLPEDWGYKVPGESKNEKKRKKKMEKNGADHPRAVGQHGMVNVCM